MITVGDEEEADEEEPEEEEAEEEEDVETPQKTEEDVDTPLTWKQKLEVYNASWHSSVYYGEIVRCKASAPASACPSDPADKEDGNADTVVRSHLYG